jgi:ornithine decarboxylase
MKLHSLEEIRSVITEDAAVETPILWMDADVLRANSRLFRREFGAENVYFSVKANNTPEVLAILADEGVHFDVASAGEIAILQKLGVAPERLVFSAPTKLPRDIIMAYEYGIRTFAFDSRMELQKLAELAPGCQVNARMVVPNTGSEWPLEHKFGLNEAEVLDLMPYALSLGLQPFGLAFHVGSQNSRPQTWADALQKMADVDAGLLQKGIHLQVIDMGGGFPMSYAEDVPDVAEIAAVVRQFHHEHLRPELQIWVEPGRRMVADAGVMVSTVINRAERGSQTWLYVDASTYHGLIEAGIGFRFPVLTDRNGGTLRPFTLAGPTCDSADKIMEDVLLPDDITLGDRIYMLRLGAYTTSMEKYNGMGFPGTLVG